MKNIIVVIQRQRSQPFFHPGHLRGVTDQRSHFIQSRTYAPCGPRASVQSVQGRGMRMGFP